MPGVPGSGGPVPKRSDQRHGHRTAAELARVDRPPAAADVEPPEPDPEWHPVATRWYKALAESGQAAYYEPSDWATAYVLAESMSRDLRPQVVAVVDGEPVKAERPFKGATLAAYSRVMNGLLVTEGDRRRSRIELQRAAAETPPDVPNLDEYRRRAMGE